MRAPPRRRRPSSAHPRCSPRPFSGLFANICFPCALDSLVEEIIAADPNSKDLHGCCPSACCSWTCCFCFAPGWCCWPNLMMLPPIHTRLTPAGASPNDQNLNPASALCCAPCVVIRLQNEVDIRRAAKQPILQRVYRPGAGGQSPAASPHRSAAGKQKAPTSPAGRASLKPPVPAAMTQPANVVIAAEANGAAAGESADDEKPMLESIA